MCCVVTVAADCRGWFSPPPPLSDPYLDDHSLIFFLWGKLVEILLLHVALRGFSALCGAAPLGLQSPGSGVEEDLGFFYWGKNRQWYSAVEIWIIKSINILIPNYS